MHRGFEIVSKYEDQGINVPYRTTQQAAGYDFECAEDFTLPSIWRHDLLHAFKRLWHRDPLTTEELVAGQHDLKPWLVPTGVKAYMAPGEVLLLANRSSNPLKHNLILPNGVGVIDADYYNNEKNEGEIFVQLVNVGLKDQVIKKGQRIAQGIFMPFLLADGERIPSQQRTGGFGSSDRN
ncbi:dCTP deaminase/dUTPase family protein [Levilactobacillus parabrevis]|uniref:dUTP diphosphatase n=1 Tax=Levilactobacillus parabrevis ATCC 53295 TaxID=1267003 RepID=A0A0R1GIU8_9LACO|nr:dUTPase [Levilactobacillus parabrevis]KRK34038.1 dUTPase [Levilactobacillus parabrevis ATCC 53295]KRO04663.1 dUTPase [Levilactobacillus parabrevis]MCT4487593.1 dUTP diphosphatase [Levilactobacillus parabrevis]MCT4489698.1 dUTP diphosphatase [Levilactobacillus parabrevis]